MSIPFRQIHLDFHTSEHIVGVGAAWDKRHWQATLQRGHVDSINVLAVCHHGGSYYHTAVGQRHPGLEAGCDPTSCCDLRVALRLDRPVRRVTLQPQGIALPFQAKGDRIELSIDRFTCHQMVAISHLAAEGAGKATSSATKRAQLGKRRSPQAAPWKGQS